jgi:enterochelin esterase family protein
MFCRLDQHIIMNMMKFAPFWALGLCLTGMTASGAAATDNTYYLGPDSAPHPGVPKGNVIGPSTLASAVFPNTTRNYWVYVPAQYDPSKPACLMVFQDGFAYVDVATSNAEFLVPYVFDNLIYRREMPVTIGVFVNAGHTTNNPNQREPSYADWGDRVANRGLEYNTVDDKYSRMIIEELMPVLAKQYNLSPDPENRGIVGASSGAICAFTVAWERPDQFRKVISSIGTFRGRGAAYPDMIRTNAPKPIRVFLCDGVNDFNHEANLNLLAALTAQKYDVNYTWGIGTHSHKQAGAIMPDMLRWLWRDYPRDGDPGSRTLFVPASHPSTETNVPAAISPR